MFRLLAFMVLMMTALISHAEVLPTPTLSATVSVAETAASDNLSIVFTLTNTSAENIRFLKWGTPFENGFNSNMFEVWQSNTQTPYIGKILKRGSPRAKDFIQLEAGESLIQVLDITDGYAAYHAGDYTISFKSSISFIENDPIEFKSNTYEGNFNALLEQTLESEPITASLDLDRFPIAQKQAPAFSSCGRSERSQLDEALTQAEIMAEESSRILTNTPADKRANASRYSTWFGNYHSSRYTTVSQHFDKIYDVIANRQVNFDCSCDVDNPGSIFAYVSPGDPYRVHLCGQFWKASMTGQDSKAGTLIHEMSHFYAVASTDDHAYGRSSVETLANQDPDRAIDNADGYEYFAENTPALSMGGSSQPQPEPEHPTSSRLNINQALSSEIASGEWLYYQVQGASKIVLSNMSEDFDLYVKADGIPSFDDYDCNPFYLGLRTETCDVSSTDTIYVAVNAVLGGGTFTLMAEGPISAPKRGLWWNPQRDGTGFDIEINDDKLAVVWYTYDENRNPIWYLANGSYANHQGIAKIRQFRWTGGQARSEIIGSLQIDFSDTTHGNLNWTLGEQSGQQSINFITLSNQPAENDHSGIWYEPAQPGYGMTVVEQGSVVVTVLYFYDASGEPVWALGNNQTGYRLDIYRGSCPYCSVIPTSYDTIGQLSFNFDNLKEGTLSTQIKLKPPLSGSWNISNASIRNLAQ